MKKTDNQTITENIKDQVSEQTEVQTDIKTDDVESATDKVAENDEDSAQIWQDKYIRLSAEFDNFRKRTVKEKMDLIANGGERVLKSIIEIADDFERALKSLNSNSAEYIGIELIYKKLTEILKTNGVKQIEALNQPLDVDYHEAIAKFPSQDTDKIGIIIDVVQSGYLLNDKVLRFAKVVVGE